jgi:hypothetical protein
MSAYPYMSQNPSAEANWLESPFPAFEAIYAPSAPLPSIFIPVKLKMLRVAGKYTVKTFAKAFRLKVKTGSRT